MHAVAFNTLRTTRGPLSRRACRVIAGVRHPTPFRYFHNSPIRSQIPENPAWTENDAEEIPAEGQEVEVEPDLTVGKADNVGVASLEDKEKGQTLTAFKQRGKKAKTTSGRTRGSRSKPPEGLPPVLLPDWFLRDNVKLAADSDQSGSLAVYGDVISQGEHKVTELDESNSSAEVEVNREEASNSTKTWQSESIIQSGLTSSTEAKYSIHVDVYQEVLATIRASLVLRPPKNTSSPITRPVTILQCPRDGGTYYLDSVVETIASKLGADLIRLDAQDIAEIVGSYADENLAWTAGHTSLLGYDVHRIAGRFEEYDKDTNNQEEHEAAEEDEEGQDFSRNPKPAAFTTAASFILPQNFSKSISSMINNIKSSPQQKSTTIAGMEMFSPRGQMFNFGSNTQAQMQAPDEDHWRQLKLSTAVSALIDTADCKRASATEGTSTDVADVHLRGLIIQIRDYKEMVSGTEGAELLSKLRTAINKRWQEGRNIICVGTTSSEHGESALSRPDIQHLQSDVFGNEKRTIFVPSDRREEQENVFESDDKVRIRNINIRHVEEMLRKLTEGTPAFSIPIDVEKDLDSAAVYAVGLEDAVWAYPRIYRLVTTILGLEPSLTNIDGNTFGKALRILASSDEAKFAWGAAELKSEDVEVENMIADIAKAGNAAKKQMSDKLRQIRKTCNTHEKKLLGGVVVPADIKTTFDSIRAPKETIEALKTLTSLSLIRPEAFSYGVLATDKIPGLLLYGPPGTGKTLLAKAVAKESGATVLEVSGADVNDMFVGEAEKNVKAVFSLAKKLSPCIVFIDEADAIFAARGDMKQRSSHRELINQFLREWDGMNEMSAFIMLATNRPFDLDEAVLRRLPRRLLVDLPVEKDREAILKIHLREEILDESVSLPKIAKDTPFYSGSDLKNVSVAAALACIREENDIAAQHTGEDPYVYPAKRILTKAHFDKALEEISASISEDMSTLTAIRKSDEKYGDRKGRRKKGAALGFGGTQIVEKDSEAARVRNMEV